MLSGADSTEAIKEHVRVKQEALLEKIKMKRAASLEPNNVKETHGSEGPIEVKKVTPVKQPS